MNTTGVQLGFRVDKGPAAGDVPDLATFDWIVVSTSGGKDSMVATEATVAAARAAGVLDRVVSVHADLGDRVEWGGVPELARAQAEFYGVPRFEVVRANPANGDLLGRVEARGMWPSPAMRWCTSDLKRGPIRTVFTRLSDEWRSAGGQGRCRILNVIGYRWEESAARAKKVAYCANPAASTKTTRQVLDWYPVLALRADEMWARIHASGAPYHPAYAFMPRLSCTFCIFAPKSALVAAARRRPELAAEYARVEATIGHRFQATLSMAEVVAEAERLGDTPIEVATWAA